VPPAKRIALLACALLGAFAVASPASAAEAGNGCDPVADPAAERWTCTFADEFDGGALDRDRWSVMTTATSGFSHAWECYVDDPANVSVDGGALRLTSTKSSKAENCGSLFTSPYRSGMVFSKDKFSQAYGRFEARIRFPTGIGFTSSWWLWPQDMAYGRQSGEIDIAEHFGSHPQIASPYVHIIGPDGEGRGRGEYCNVADPEGGFHTYALEWDPLGKLVFLYDGVTCMTFDQWDPGAPLTYPQPFDKEFFLNLTLAHGWPPNAVSDSTPFPATMAVDYVRAWSANPDYEPPTVEPPPAPETPDDPTVQIPDNQIPRTPPPATGASVSELKIANTNLSKLVRSGELELEVQANGPGTVRLKGKAKGMPRSLFKTATLRFATAGTKAGKLKLTKAGRKALERRARANVKITAKFQDPAGHQTRRQQRLKLES
jgi:beta-glucanase (GH16 family)